MPPVVWNRGPWATARPAPYQNVTEQQPQGTPLPSQPYQQLIEPTEGAGGFSEFGGPDVAGPMTSSERSTVGQIAGGLGGLAATNMGLEGMSRGMVGSGLNTGMRAGMTAAGLSAANPGLGMISGILGAILGMDRPSFRNIMGWGPERNIMEATPAEQQAAADKFGYGMPGAPEGLVGGVSVGPGGYGTTGPSLTGAPSVANPDSPLGPNSGGGDGPDSDSGGPGPGGGGMSDSGGAEARGGVRKTKPGKPMNRTFGERGPEKAIFIPEKGSQFDMTKPGIQGNERQVRSGIRSAYRSLMPRGGR